MSSLVIVLGQFWPTHLDSETIARELDVWFRERGVISAAMSQDGDTRLPIAVRSGENVDTSIIGQWHRDGCSDPFNADEIPSVHRMIVWSNGTATEFLNESRFNAGDVLLVDNHKARHRCPPREDNRWFARLLEPVFK